MDISDIHLFSNDPDHKYIWEIWRSQNTITCSGSDLLNKSLHGGYYTLIKVIQETCRLVKVHRKKQKRTVVKIVLLSCPGGDMPILELPGMMALCKMMDKKLRFEMYCVGDIASAATVWMASVEWDKVFLYKNSKYIVHLPSVMLDEYMDTTDLKNQSEKLERLVDHMADIYALCSKHEGKNKSKKFFINLMTKSSKNGKKISAQEIVNIGLATKIY